MVFELPALDWPFVYLTAQTMICMSLTLQTKTGGKPVTGRMVGPINNFCHSFFEGIEIFVNSKSLSDGLNYSWKAFVTTQLGKSDSYKMCYGNTHLFFNDTEDRMGARSTNLGFMERRRAFLDLTKTEGEAKLNPFKDYPTEFIFPILTELSSTDSPLIPGTKVRYEFVRSSDAFLIMAGVSKDGRHEELYRFYLHSMNMKVLVGQMTELMWKSIKNKITGDYAYKLPYRRCTVSSKCITEGTSKFSLENIFVHTNPSVPCRLIVWFVENPASSGAQGAGDQQSNPFNFKRMWLDKVDNLNQDIYEISEKYDQPVEVDQDFDMRSCVAASEDDFELAPHFGPLNWEESVLDRLDKLEANELMRERTRKMEDMHKQRELERKHRLREEEKEEYGPYTTENCTYIKQVQLYNHGSPWDQMTEINNLDDMTIDYFRLYQYCGYMQQNSDSCSITKKMFNKSCYMKVFDISGAGESNYE
jgi:hypothetical protein